MSCDRSQRQTAETATTTGISRSGNTVAGMAGRNGQSGDSLSGQRVPRPRRVRRAIKAYQKLPVTQKEKLWAALGEAALCQDEIRRRQQLKQAVRRYGGGVVAAALAEETNRFQRAGDDGSLQQMQAVKHHLVEVVAEVSVEQNAPPSKTVAANNSEDQTNGYNDASERAKTEKPPSKPPATFSQEELARMKTLTLLGSAAVGRQLQLLKAGVSRGIGHSDPRPEDWLEQDRQNFRFLSRQLTAGARNGAALETTGLNEAELVDLWEFSRFEADRALRNIDHLQSGWSHLKGETAAYMTRDHRLEARFYTWLANHLEPGITPELRDKYGAVEV